eukprot:scaffold35166_cov50-Attheya_sp.AAC.4
MFLRRDIPALRGNSYLFVAELETTPQAEHGKNGHVIRTFCARINRTDTGWRETVVRRIQKQFGQIRRLQTDNLGGDSSTPT